MGLEFSLEYRRVMYSPIIPKANRIKLVENDMATINEVNPNST
jgi:hypothetical protein